MVQGNVLLRWKDTRVETGNGQKSGLLDPDCSGLPHEPKQV